MAVLPPSRSDVPARKQRVVLTIRRKILTASLAMTLVTAALGEFAVHGIDVTGALLVNTYDHTLLSVGHARVAAIAFAQADALLGQRRLAGDAPERIAALDAAQQALLERAQTSLAAAAAQALSPDVAEAAQAADAALAAWRATRDRLLAAPAGRATPEPADWEALEHRRAVLTQRIDALIDHAASSGQRRRERALTEAGSMRQVTWLLLGLSVALSGSVALLLLARIIGPVRAASDAARSIAEGRLTTEIPEGGADELGQLLRSMAVMREAIRTMMEREVAQRRSAQGRLADALEHSPEGVVLVDAGGRMAAANARMAEFFPSVAGLLAPGTPVLRLLAAMLRGRLVEAGNRPARRRLGRRLRRLGREPIELLLRDGRWLRISRSLTRDGGVIAVCSDITVARHREHELERANLYLDVALNNMIQGLCLFGPDQRLVLANQRFGAILGVPPAGLRPGTALADILAASVAAGHPGSAGLGTLGTTPSAGSATRRIEDLRPGLVVEIAQAPLPDGGWVATLEDITERSTSEARIAFLARHDALTGLPNRAQLVERLHDAVATLGRGEGFAVMCLDLDHFKAVNETLGHSYGDRLLVAAGERLQAALREDDAVGRLGADEFALIQRDISRPEDAWELAERLLTALATPFELEGQPVAIAASIGIALAPADGADAETLLKNAASALSRAKQDGRGSYRSFEIGMDARLQARRSMELDLRRALPAGEFAVHYQPLVDTGGQRVTGFEALLRWQHPAHGLISPAAFVPLAEETGLIVPIGEWVLRTACAEASRWPGRLKVAVNVSPVQFKDNRLITVVEDALACSGLPPELLELEVTESVLLQNNVATLKMLHALHEIGVRISMDDFGTGYSSLSYLRSFPFDKIKIDQSFVRDLASSADAAAIIRAITALGASLGIRTTAEGVETEQQLAQLRAEGCSELQGYLFSRPIPPEQVPALIARINADRGVWEAEDDLQAVAK